MIDLDTNDFTPTFVGQPYQKSLDENVIVGTTVLLINATDDDFGPSGELTYSIKSLENLPFVINPQTGFKLIYSIIVCIFIFTLIIFFYFDAVVMFENVIYFITFFLVFIYFKKIILIVTF